ncbi:MAG TPA: transglutaminase domain-containing protein [Bacteroides reticulotermitis]|nr:transglutaminase domain-containing protein [Bacteroides reticulotermitis]
MRKLAVLLLTLCLANVRTIAQSEDDNILITHKDVTYEYTTDKNGQVVIKEKYIAEYEASRMAGHIDVYEMYNNESSIDRVKVKGIRGVTPQYKLYSSNNIFYSDAKICYFRMNMNEKGKTAQVEFEKSYNNPRYFTIIPLAESQFVKRKTVRVVVPAWMKVELVDYNFKSNVTKEILTNQKDQSKTYVYTLNDQNAMVSEAFSQGPTFIYPHILVLNKQADIKGVKTTYFETLADQYAWYQHIISDMNNDKDIIANKAKEITKDCVHDLEKIKSIYAWVQSNIRYVAFEDGIAGFKPDDAQEVLRKKYGDCKGMANLTQALLEAEGFDARLTWIGTNHIAYDYSTPNLSVDNHMICTLFYEGKMYYLDPTYEYMPLGEYPQSIQGRQVMIQNKDQFILDRVPVASPQANTDSLHCKFTIKDNQLNGEVSRYFMGEAKERILSLIHATPKDKVSEALKNFAERGNVQDKAANLKLEGETPKTHATSLCYLLENKSGIQQLDKELYIGMDLTQDFSSQLIDLKKRKNDLLFPYRYRMVREIELIIPAEYSLTHTPENLLIDRENYLFISSYTRKDNILTYRSEVMIKDPLLKKSTFKQWNDDINLLKKSYAEQIVLLTN